MPSHEVAARGAWWAHVAPAPPEESSSAPDHAVEENAEQLEARVLALGPDLIPMGSRRSTRSTTVREAGGAARAGPTGHG